MFYDMEIKSLRERNKTYEAERHALSEHEKKARLVTSNSDTRLCQQADMEMRTHRGALDPCPPPSTHLHCTSAGTQVRILRDALPRRSWVS